MRILWTLLRSQRLVCLCQRTKQMTFWEIGVGLWSTAHFVYNSGRSRGGAWEAQAPLLFLDQTEAAPDDRKNFTGDPPPPPPPYFRVWMTGCYYSPVPPKPLLAL